MLKIETSFYPFRMKLAHKEPVQLKVNIRNMGNEDVLASYDVVVSRAMSLDKGGFKTSVNKRLGNLQPGQTIEEYYEIFPKYMSDAGKYPVMVKATEHYQNYNFVKNEYKKKLDLPVED